MMSPVSVVSHVDVMHTRWDAYHHVGDDAFHDRLVFFWANTLPNEADIEYLKADTFILGNHNVTISIRSE